MILYLTMSKVLDFIGFLEKVTKRTMTQGDTNYK